MREVPVPEPVSRAFSSALAELRESIIGLHFGLDLPGAVEARKLQAEILSQLGNYVIPRVHMSTAPALIVVAGSTGAGKSTIVNSLAGAKISATGVRRPTTGTPVLVCHPGDRDWFAKGSVLSGLTRVTAPGLAPGMSSFVLSSSHSLPEGVALLDTPDIDSVVEEHHEIAHRMLDVADLWVFVTTAARYADAPSWQMLKLAKERGARLVIVLARVPLKAREVVLKHFSRMLDDYGLGEVERFVIHETTVSGGRLPEEEIRELRMWLAELSVDGERRTRAVRTTLDGALNSFRVRIPALARQLEAQVAFRAELRTDVDAAYMAALAEIDETTRNGSLLRGEVLARWQDFAGSGDIRHTLHLRRPGRFAGRARQEAPMRLSALKSALRAGLESIIIAAAQRAAEDVVGRWRNRTGAGDRLAATSGLGRPSEELVRRTGQAVSAWQDHLVELVRTEGVTKRSIARVLSFDVDSLAVVFAVGLLGYEASEIASGTGGSLPERLLRGLLGAESLRSIGAKARSDLRARIGMLFDEETMRYVHVLDSAGIPDESAATRLYQATYNLEVAR
jgi:energy-coupling factor transporter ATP-binding protein EcfA2